MNKTAENLDLKVIGSTELVEIAGIKNIPAKVDTGADSSSIWASNIDMGEDGTLTFSLFGSGSPFYTGERLRASDYKVKSVRSSHGDKQIRYQIILPLKVGSHLLNASFTLANRSRNCFPVLIGRRTIKGKFLVDVSKTAVARNKISKSLDLNRKLQENPYQFHQKYVK